jgi:catechol-2,3-dioxygenase
MRTSIQRIGAGGRAEHCKEMQMSEINFRLDHINIPAREPERLANWYAENFELQANGRRATGPGMLIVFQAGEPVNRAPDLHIGFRVPTMEALMQLAERFGQEVTSGAEFNAFRITDPEGNCIELYCKASSSF